MNPHTKQRLTSLNERRRRYPCYGVGMNNKGFTLLEVIAAIFLVTLGVFATFTVVQQIISYSSISSNRLIAAYLCQEGIEIVRNIRDGNWLERRTATTTPWDEGLGGCSLGCEADYTILGVEDPSLSSYQDRYLYIDGTDGFYRYIGLPLSTDIKTNFKRKITITPEDSDILKVFVLVQWQERGRTHNLTAKEKLYNWR